MNMQMPYLFMPGMPQMPNMCPYSNNNNVEQKINELENKVNNLEERVKRLEERNYSPYHTNNMQGL
jgi:hypothetical protein